VDIKGRKSEVKGGNTVKKRPFFIFFSLISISVLSACHNDDAAPAKEAQNKQGVTNGGTPMSYDNQSENTSFNFSKFDLEVDYKGLNNDYEADYENENDEIEAKVDDNINDEHLNGDKAFNKLSSKFKKLNFDQRTPDEDVKKEVIDAFGLKKDFQSFELEVRFSNGTEKEYNFKQK
jgi:hypothetical protein